MAQLFYDQRWCAPHGIGRFASEIRKRIADFMDIEIAGSPTSPLDAIRLARHLRSRSADGYFSPGFSVPAWATCPVITTIHDLIHVKFRAERTLAKASYYRYVQRPIVRRSPVTLTVSEYSRGEIIQWYDVPESRVVCVGNGVSQAFTPCGAAVESDRPFFLYVGNSKPHKNLDTLLSAMGAVKLASRARLILVTDSSTRLRAQISAFGLEPDVAIVSGISDQQLATYYRAAVAMVLPSHYEGFGLPIVEAMACGCPVIGSDCTSIPEVLGGAGELFDPNEPEELAEKMLRLLGDAGERASLSQKGLARASTFTWDSVAARVREAISPHLS